MLRLNRRSLQKCLRALDRVSVAADKAALAAVSGGGFELFGVIKQNMSLKDHTLQELAEKDHPYASRHGSIQIHRSGTQSLANPEFRVHTHSGKLLRSLKTFQHENSAGPKRFSILADRGVAEHAEYVLLGTKIMLARNVFDSAAAAPKTRQAVDKRVSNTLKGRLAKVGVRVK
jgi:hypothetical protein